MVIDSGTARAQPLASATVTVAENVPACVGVPAATPLDESERPGGSDPAVMAIA